MEISRNTKFIAAIILQVVIVLAIILFKVAIIGGGTNVLLRIEPVDPRDPLRGDYVTFQYTISNINQYMLKNETMRKGDTVYVPLRKSGKYWHVNRFVQKDKPSGDQLFIKGVVTHGDSPATPVLVEERDMRGSAVPPVPTIDFQRRSLRVSYGIEEYFIPEGVGMNFNFRSRDSSALVAIDRNGNAVLKQIFVDDKPWP